MFIGTQFSILYTFMYSPAKSATHRNTCLRKRSRQYRSFWTALSPPAQREAVYMPICTKIVCDHSPPLRACARHRERRTHARRAPRNEQWRGVVHLTRPRPALRLVRIDLGRSGLGNHSADTTPLQGSCRIEAHVRTALGGHLRVRARAQQAHTGAPIRAIAHGAP